MNDIKHPLIILAGIFVSSLVLLGLVYWNFPKLDPSEKQYIRLPRRIEDAKHLGRILSAYKDQYYCAVVGGIIITYVFLQSFAIPGSIFLSILCGYLFSFPLALIIICTCSAVGASVCYLLSFLVGRRIVYTYFPDKVQLWAMQVAKHRDDLFNYIVFLRITPFLPNWFINISSPLIDVPFVPFFVGTFIGVAPPSFVAIQTGKTLHKAAAGLAPVGWKNVILLAVFAAFALLPIVYKHKLKAKLQ